MLGNKTVDISCQISISKITLTIFKAELILLQFREGIIRFKIQIMKLENLPTLRDRRIY